MDKVEYCFLWMNCACLPSSDWAAWMQAIGTILALGVAIGIAVYQHQKAKKAQDQQLQQRRSAQAQVAHYFAMRVNLIFDEAYKAGQTQEIYRMRLQGKKLADILSWSRTFPFDTLSYEKMNSFIRIRDKAFELMIFSEEAGLGGGSGTRQVKVYFEEIAADIFWFGINIPDWSEYNPMQ